MQEILYKKYTWEFQVEESVDNRDKDCDVIVINNTYDDSSMPGKENKDENLGVD